MMRILYTHLKSYLKYCLILSSLFINSSVSASTIEGVLVSSKNSTTVQIQRKDLRRIFLGIRAAEHYQVNKPVLNLSDHKTYSLFLKNIMYLTESGYKRKLIKRVFRQGADQIQQIENTDQLTQHLASHPNDISFMSKQEALKHNDLKIIQVLW